MASFEEILKRKYSEFKPPQPFPVGMYHCLIEGQPTPGKSSQKGTDFLRFQFKILKAMDGVDQALAAEMQVVGKLIPCEYYITDAASNRCTEMLVEHAGIDPGGEPGSPTEKSLEELLAEAPGRQLMVTIKHEFSPDGKRVYSRVASTAHV